ncbi:MAG: hypothetical protein FJ290_15675 [Planctomycetes bacterium]|nr:hypothetical protein [Planctomycetota bacterium]
MMKALLAIGAAGALVLAGCGGGGEEAKGQAGEEAALRAALVEYLRVGSMDMKPEKFESIEVMGDKATAKVRMAPKDDTYRLKPTWVVTFGKTGKGWQVAEVKR